MEICSHLVKESEIVGISPLMVQSSNDPVRRSLYNPKSYYFHVHLKNQSIKIESETISCNGITDSDKEYLEKFKKEYEDTRFKIDHLITD